MKYSKAQIARIMKLEELKRVDSAIWMLDMRKRHADKIRKQRRHKQRMKREQELIEGHDRWLEHHYWSKQRSA